MGAPWPPRCCLVLQLVHCNTSGLLSACPCLQPCAWRRGRSDIKPLLAKYTYGLPPGQRRAALEQLAAEPAAGGALQLAATQLSARGSAAAETALWMDAAAVPPRRHSMFSIAAGELRVWQLVKVTCRAELGSMCNIRALTPAPPPACRPAGGAASGASAVLFVAGLAWLAARQLRASAPVGLLHGTVQATYPAPHSHMHPGGASSSRGRCGGNQLPAGGWLLSSAAAWPTLRPALQVQASRACRPSFPGCGSGLSSRRLWSRQVGGPAGLVRRWREWGCSSVAWALRLAG